MLFRSSGSTAECAILAFDPASGRVTRIRELPHPLTHAAGASLGGWFYLLGGRGEGLESQRSSILAVDPRSGTVRAAGRLPRALSDIGAASPGGSIVAVGRREAGGAVSNTALTLLPVSR